MLFSDPGNQRFALVSRNLPPQPYHQNQRNHGAASQHRGNRNHAQSPSPRQVSQYERGEDSAGHREHKYAAEIARMISRKPRRDSLGSQRTDRGESRAHQQNSSHHAAPGIGQSHCRPAEQGTECADSQQSPRQHKSHEQPGADTPPTVSAIPEESQQRHQRLPDSSPACRSDTRVASLRLTIRWRTGKEQQESENNHCEHRFPVSDRGFDVFHHHWDVLRQEQEAGRKAIAAAMGNATLIASNCVAPVFPMVAPPIHWAISNDAIMLPRPK